MEVEEQGTKSLERKRRGWSVEEDGPVADGTSQVAERDGAESREGGVKGDPRLLLLAPGSLAISGVEGPDGCSGS